MAMNSGHRKNSTLQGNYTVATPDIASVGELTAVTSLYAVLMAAILVGNGLILAAFVINKRLRTVTNRLVIGLAVSDILVGLVSIPCWIYIYISQYYALDVSDALLQFYAASDIFLGSACILQLTSISIERCHAVARPFKHRTLSKRAFYAMILTPWCYAGFVAVLHPLQYRHWTEVYTILMTTTCFFIPLIVIILTYSCIIKFVRSKLRHKLTEKQFHRRVYRREVRLATTVALITVIFVIEWLPLFVMTVVATYYPSHLPSPLWRDRLLKFVKWMHYSNSALDMFIYAYRNPDISSTFHYMARRAFCRGTRSSELYRQSLGFRRNSSRCHRSSRTTLGSSRRNGSGNSGRKLTFRSNCEHDGRNTVREKRSETVVGDRPPMVCSAI